MDFKIITLEKYDAEVCITRLINIDGRQAVKLSSFIFNEDEVEHFLQEEIVFSTGGISQDFIEDYSVNSAVNWLIYKAEVEGIQLE